MKRKLLGLGVMGSVIVATTVLAFAQGLTYDGYPMATVTVNGQTLQSDVPAVILDGRVMVPLRAVSQALGVDVSWDGATQTVKINTQSNTATTPSACALDAATLYTNRCAACHGSDGQGGAGPSFSQMLNDLPTVNNLADFIRTNMPLGAGGTLNYNETTALANYIQSQAGSLPPTSSTTTENSGASSPGTVPTTPTTPSPAPQSPVTAPLTTPNTTVPSLTPTTGSPSSTGTYAGGASDHWVQSVSDDGSIVTLEDGSVWQIDDADQADVSTWTDGDSITVVESSNSIGGYKLVDTDQGETADAKLLDQ